MSSIFNDRFLDLSLKTAKLAEYIIFLIQVRGAASILGLLLLQSY